mmetsp:Transcript_79975/g.126176  ORF Transcript_79975/g.126176 Transcript_79975/m.126176 type:complete len:89 (+) Transcript_79975:269-535(+)
MSGASAPVLLSQDLPCKENLFGGMRYLYSGELHMEMFAPRLDDLVWMASSWHHMGDELANLRRQMPERSPFYVHHDDSHRWVASCGSR